MVFNSIEFAIFLPIVFLLYWFVFNRSLKLQNLFIVIVSYIFYGWWDWRYLCLIAFTSFCSWGSGLIIQNNRRNIKKAKAVSAVNIVLNLAILGVFKYYNFFITSFANVFLGGKTDGLLLNIILPVGISFYTFQALSYSIDVYRGKIEPTRDVVEFFAFVSFFPQLVAGPIERATNLLPQFQRKRVFDYSQATDGCRQILWGLFKKMVVADNCAVFVDEVFSTYQAQTGSNLMLAAILFSFQIYGDFSGYSDIAIGTSKLFGIKLMRNFNVPYFSRDIAEFWRRWHISLTTWFRDYIYIPLGGSRCSKAKIVRNTFIIFLVSGLWHGANWTFLAWGGYHAVLFLPLILSGKNRKYIDVVASGRFLPGIREVIRIFVTFMLVLFGWILFRSESIGQAWEYVCRMWQWETLEASFRLFSQAGVGRRTFYVFIMLLTEWVNREKEHGLKIPNNMPWYLRYVLYLVIAASIVFWSGTNQSFIYFQF
ncbi:MAG: MBOAT family protein [Bacteroidales bacterium]|nr:MBOAT family protein [Bacteroidales bacterium]